jgi:hypothetical protein
VTNGVLIFKGMRVGILPGDFTINLNETCDKGGQSKLILSTAYNVLPIWIRIARDNLREAKIASDAIATKWPENTDEQKQLLILELAPSLQVFVSCGIVLDALYDQLRPYSKLSESDIAKWKDNKTARAKQIAEVIRRVYNIEKDIFSQIKKSIKEIIKYRDLAVHPSLDLQNALPRPDLPVGVDWKFCFYRFQNSEACFNSTMQILMYLYQNECSETVVTDQIKNIFDALLELKVVQLRKDNASPTSE